MLCPKCSSSNDDSALFCQICGETFASSPVKQKVAVAVTASHQVPEKPVFEDDDVQVIPTYQKFDDSEEQYFDVDEDQLTKSRIFAFGSIATFVISFIFCVIFSIIRHDKLFGDNDGGYVVVLTEFLFSLLVSSGMTYFYCGIIIASKWFWKIFSSIFMGAIGLWWAIFSAVWWTLLGAILMLIPLLIIVGFGLIFGLMFYVITCGFTGFCTCIYRIGMSIRTLLAHNKGLDVKENHERAKTIFGTIQALFSIGLFLLVFFTAAKDSALFFASTNFFTRSLNTVGLIGILPAAIVFLFF